MDKTPTVILHIDDERPERPLSLYYNQNGKAIGSFNRPCRNCDGDCSFRTSKGFQLKRVNNHQRLSFAKFFDLSLLARAQMTSRLVGFILSLDQSTGLIHVSSVNFPINLFLLPFHVRNEAHERHSDWFKPSCNNCL